jgi:hypothetical protein
VTRELRAGPISAITLKKIINAMAVLNMPSAIKESAEFIEMLEGHWAIATGAQKTLVIAIANPLIAIPSTSGKLVVTMIMA